MKVSVDEHMLQKIGDNSLIGKLMAENGHELPGEVELVFPQTSTEWRREHDGPAAHLVYEYNVPCFLRDVLFLIQNGVNVTLSMPTKDP